MQKEQFGVDEEDLQRVYQLYAEYIDEGLLFEPGGRLVQ